MKLFIPLLCLACFVTCGDEPSDGGAPTRCPAGEQLVRERCVPIEDAGDRTDAGEDAAADATPDIAEDVAQDVPDTNECINDQIDCLSSEVPRLCQDGAWVEQSACAATEICSAGLCVPGADCTPGQVLSCFDELSQFVCNADGSGFESRACDDGLFCFRGECGTQICEPGALSCDTDGLFILECATSGEERVRTVECDQRQDLVCVSGECVSGCSAAIKNPTYIGCEYWSADLPQFDDPFSNARATPHAVVLSNTGNRPAEVRVETESGIALVDSSITIAPGTVGTINFPVANVEGTSRSLNSFRISTSEPVVAYQFNPLNNASVASNDASLLLPANAIGREYYVMSWPSGVITPFAPTAQNGWFTIIATREGTTRVTITFSAKVTEGTEPQLQGITAGMTRTFTMEQYEVLNFEGLTELSGFTGEIADLTGTHIEADRAVVVFGGHGQAVLGEEEPGGGTPCCADHLEEQMFPVNTWGTRYPAVHSPPRGTEPDLWRVMAATDGTRISTVPPIAGLDGVTLNAGEFVDANVVESFEIVGSQPILVAHYLVSQQDYRISSTKGDPSMILAVASEQFRDDYSILVPGSYSEDWVTVIRPAGVAVHLDGNPIADASFTAFGSNTFEFAHVPVEPGPHLFETPGEERFGIAAYGYSGAVSYGYPGGLNLATEFGTGTTP